VLTATVTPFDADGAVDLDRYRELCAFLVDNGSDGVVVNGTTGEASTLSEEERVDLIRTPWTRSATAPPSSRARARTRPRTRIHLTEQAHEAGAHAVLVVTPYYNKPPQRGSSSTSRPSPPPQAAPWWPTTSGPRRDQHRAETMTELAEIPNVTAVSSRTPTSTRRATSSTSASTSTPATTTWSCRSWSSAAGAVSACTRTSSDRR
jgi:4-hydroxy-tetrahydrodipicolinate synthase